MPPAPNLWSPLEGLPALDAVAFTWRRLYGPLFEPLLKTGVLIFTSNSAGEHPCTHAVPCPCFHRVDAGNSQRKARCTCEPADCPPFTVRQDELRYIRLSLHKLAMMAAAAFGLKGRIRRLSDTIRTYDLGVWYAEPACSYRVFACLADSPDDVFQSAATLLAASADPFALLTLSPAQLPTTTEQLVAKGGGVCLALSEKTTLTPDLTLRCAERPALLLAPLHRKAPRQVLSITEVEKLFDLAHKLNVRFRRGPTGRQFMDLYCREGMGLRKIARQMPGWTYGTVRNVRDRLVANGIDLDAACAYFRRSPDEELADKDLTGDRVYRKGLVDS